MNRVLFPERERGGFHVNPQCVGDAEARQIDLLLDGFVENFLVRSCPPPPLFPMGLLT